MDSEEKYFNFPIHLLQNAFNDISTAMNNITDYAIYVRGTNYTGTRAQKGDAAAKYFGITLGSANRTMQNGSSIFYETPKKSPMVGINKDILFDFYKNPKTEFEIAVLLAYLALKSIIGTKPYIHITNEFLIARMGGYASIKAMPDVLPKPLLDYSTRRKLDRIKFELRAKWNVNIYGYRIRGFYVSIDNKLSLEKLIYEVEKTRKTNVEKRLREKQNVAMQTAKNRLKNEYTN